MELAFRRGGWAPIRQLEGPFRIAAPHGTTTYHPLLLSIYHVAA